MKRTTKALMIGGTAFGTAAIANQIIGSRAKGLEAGLSGERGVYLWEHGAVRYTVAGDGEPVLLVHSIGAGASSFEWRDNFGPISERFRCYAPDLLGFGISDKPPISYSAPLYSGLLTDFIMNAIGEPATIIASSYSAAYAVLTAQKHSQLVKRLLLISPAGMINISPTPGLGARVLGALLSVPVLGKSAYYALASRGSVEQMLGTIYFDQRRITAELIDRYWQSGHQPGADRVIRAFTSGRLDVDIQPALEKLHNPLMLVWGREARLTPLDIAGRLLEIKPEAELRIMEKAGNLPHDERPEEFNDIAISFLSRPSQEEIIHREVEEMQREAESPSGV